MDKKIDSPHSLLLHFLGQVDKYRSIIVIAVEEQADTEEGTGIVMGHSALPPHELLGALDAAAIIAEEDYRADYLENGEGQDA